MANTKGKTPAGTRPRNLRIDKRGGGLVEVGEGPPGKGDRWTWVGEEKELLRALREAGVLP